MVFYIHAILQRAYEYMNSYDHRIRTHGMGARRHYIADLVLTFPSVAPGSDVMRLRLQAKKAAHLFKERIVHELPDIRISTEWDEGVASQLCYVHANRERIIPKHGSVRVASIDMGGGTTDLAVTDYSHAVGKIGMVECIVERVDGAYLGGDDLIDRIIDQMVLKSLVIDYRLETTALSVFRKQNLDPDRKNLRIVIVREILVKLALEILKCENDQDILVSGLIEPSLLRRLETIVSCKGLDTWQISVDTSELQNIINAKCSQTIRYLAATIIDASPSVVVLAGRTTSFPCVFTAFRDALPANIKIVKFESDGDIKNIMNQVYNYSGDYDPKLSVVIGATIGFASGSIAGHVSYRIDYSQVRKSYYWGMFDSSTYQFLPDAMLFTAGSPETTRSSVHLAGKREYYIGRAYSLEQGYVVVPVYSLNINEDTNLSFERFFDNELNDESLRLVDSPYQLHDRTSFSYLYWLDHGVIGES